MLTSGKHLFDDAVSRWHFVQIAAAQIQVTKVKKFINICRGTWGSAVLCRHEQHCAEQRISIVAARVGELELIAWWVPTQ